MLLWTGPQSESTLGEDLCKIEKRSSGIILSRCGGQGILLYSDRVVGYYGVFASIPLLSFLIVISDTPSTFQFRAQFSHQLFSLGAPTDRRLWLRRSLMASHCPESGRTPPQSMQYLHRQRSSHMMPWRRSEGKSLLRCECVLTDIRL